MANFLPEMIKCHNRTALERLITDIFTHNQYNNLVRPTDNETGLTVVYTELKVLQIDLVMIYLLFWYNSRQIKLDSG